MKKTLSLLTTAVFIFLLFSSASARDITVGETKLDSATQVMNEIMSAPDSGIPSGLLSRAYGIAVIPNTIRVGLGIGGRYGEGALVVRNSSGQWSDPVFIKLVGGSLGFQAGAESTDLVLVFRTPKSVDAITQGKLTLGAQVAIAAGPVGREAEASTDAQLKAGILSYSRSRGLFAGVSLDGAVLEVDNAANASFYNTRDVSAQAILAGRVTPPAMANKFSCVVARYTGTKQQMCA